MESGGGREGVGAERAVMEGAGLEGRGGGRPVREIHGQTQAKEVDAAAAAKEG